MPKQVEVWGCRFWRLDGPSGAMAEAIKTRVDGEIVVHSQTKKSGKMWGLTTEDGLTKLIKTNKGLYEVISSFPHKVYFDYDGKVNETHDIEDIYTAINKYFPNADIAMSGSETSEKISYHFVANNYMITNPDERLKMKIIVSEIQKTMPGFDNKVYTNNRNMKCINQSKEDGRVQSPMTHETNARSHFITCGFSSEILAFPQLDEQIEHSIAIEKSKMPFDMTTLPKKVLPTPKNIDMDNLTARDILALLPLDRSFDYAYTHLVARFCYGSLISFDEYLEWLRRKDGSIQKNAEGERKWEKLIDFPNVSSAKISALLSYFYPHINKDIHFRRFNDSFFLPESVKVESLSTELYDASKYIVINFGMGGGKTYKTIEYLSGCGSYCWIAPNKALATNTIQRLKYGTGSDVCHYENVKTKDKQNGDLKEEDRLVIVANSLHYVEGKKYGTVVIDEIETLLDKWEGEFINKQGQKYKSFQTFVAMLKNAEKVILLDAFTTMKTINFINSLNDDGAETTIYEREEKMTRTVIYCEHFKEQYISMIRDIQDGKKLLIFYPYKSPVKDMPSMEQLYRTLEKESGKSGIYYNADVDDKIKAGIKDVNVAWKDMGFIIANNMITCGVNYEGLDFDKEYIFVAKHNSPRDLIQFTYRPRHLTTGIINICYLGKMEAQTTWLNDCDTIMKGCPIYKKLYNDILVERKSPMKRTIQLFANKAHYYQFPEKKHTLSDAITKEFNELYEKYQFGFDFKNVALIEYSFAEILQERVMCQQATMLEKIMLQKYFFWAKFKETAQFVKLDGDGPELLELAWNEKMTFFFDKLGYLKQNPTHFFNRLKDVNGWSSVFPECPIIKIKMPSDIKADILKNFTFKRPSMDMKNAHLIKESYNAFFNRNIITTIYDENKNCNYMCRYEYFNQFYDLVDNHMKLDDVIENVNENESIEI
jgi:hypothetical protein